MHSFFHQGLGCLIWVRRYGQSISKVKEDWTSHFSFDAGKTHFFSFQQKWKKTDIVLFQDRKKKQYKIITISYASVFLSDVTGSSGKNERQRTGNILKKIIIAFLAPD